MCDRESRDFARNEKKSTPTPKKVKPLKKDNQENKENEGNIPQCRKSLDLAPSKLDENKNCYDHPVYKDISRQNGMINRSDLSTLKHMCRVEKIDSSGKRDLLKLRLKNYFKSKMLREAGLMKPATHRGYDFLLVVDFEATCEERNHVDYPHEIIEFPGVLVNGRTGEIVDTWREYVRPVINTQLSEFCVSLTGITQETVDLASTFPQVLDRFTGWLQSHELGTRHTVALVTDGPFDVGRFLKLSCDQTERDVPVWAEYWVNLRKGFANFYKSNSSSHLKLPGLQTMLTKLDLEFEGTPHSGLDDAKNIGRVVSRMISDGAVLKVNERLELNPIKLEHGQSKTRLQHVVSVSRTQSEHWFAECRQRMSDASS